MDTITASPDAPTPYIAHPAPEPYNLPTTRAPDHIHEYRTAEGALSFIVTRYNSPKKFTPWCWDGKTWRPRQLIPAGQRPLLNLPRIAQSTAAPVLIVEGEKTAEVAAKYVLDGWVVTTWHGGADAHATAAWDALQGHPCVIWPDNDAPGHAAAHAILDRLRALKIQVAVVSLPGSLPKAWDLADTPPTKNGPAWIYAALDDAFKRACEPPAPPAMNGTHIPPHVLEGPDHQPLIKTEPADVDVPVDFIRTSTGSIKAIYANVLYLLRQYPGKWPLRFDEFSQRPFLGAEVLTDADIRQIAAWVQNEGVAAAMSVITDGIIRFSEMTRFHPIKEYLESVTWNPEIPQLNHFLVEHAGADDSDLTRSLTAKWMIQAVARIYEPGCQADATLILEGPQGMGKSTIFRELFGDRWFTDHLPDLTSKDAMLQLRGVWCVEIGELATLGRADANRIKQFLTSRQDRYRDPYGRLAADHPRACVFSGTINPGAEGYLKDATGARRFWPVKISNTVDIPEIRRKRDALWGEAVARYRAGEPWWLTEADENAAIQERQSDRYEGDPWEDAILNYVSDLEEVTTAEVLRRALFIEEMRAWTRGEMMRVGRVLGAAGWTRDKSTAGGRSFRVYKKPNEQQ